MDHSAPILTTADQRDAGRLLTRLTSWIVAAYLGGLLLLMLVMRVTPSIDVLVVLLALGAVMLGRGRGFVRDWAPFLITLLAWEAMRGVANQFGQAVRSDSVIAAERLVMFGTMPPVDLQRLFYDPGAIGVHDVALSLVYFSHFFFPIAFAFALWLRSRSRYYRFVATLMVTSFAAFATFLAMPVSPPRFAANYGTEALPVVDIAGRVAEGLGWNGFAWAYGNLVGNPVAAFPSMHAAYPVIVALFLAERPGRAALVWLPVVALIWFATVYLGHHYVVDLLGGALYAVAAYLVVRRWLPPSASDGDSEEGPRVDLCRTIYRIEQ